MTRVLIVVPKRPAKRLRKVRIESSSESDGVRESDAGTFSDSEVEEDINYCEDVNDAALPGVQNAPSSTETQTYESTAARTAEPTPVNMERSRSRRCG